MTEALRAPRLDDPRWVRLRDIIAAKSLKRGRFRLASGRESDVLFDPQTVQLHSRNVAYGCFMFTVTRSGP